MKSPTSDNLRNSPRPLADALSQLLDDIELKCSRDDPYAVVGIGTGFTVLDRITGGFRPGQLIVIGARPAMGATSLALNIASHVALEQNLPVAIFSMDLSSMMVAQKLVCQTGKLDAKKVRTGRLTSDDISDLNLAMGKLMKAVISIDDTPILTAAEIFSRTIDLHKQHGRLGLVVVDHLQCMSPLNSDDCSSKDYDETLSLLRSLAQEVGAPIVVLSQLNRKADRRKLKWPKLCDLPFRKIGQSADLVLFLYRAEYYRPDTDDKGTANLVVARNQSGYTGNVKLRFRAEQASFKDFEYTSDIPNR